MFSPIASGTLKCSGCSDPKLNVRQILNLLDLSTPIFAEIKSSSEKRIDDVELYLHLSLDQKKAELAADIERYRNLFESNGHVVFPVNNYSTLGLEHINSNSGNVIAVIDYFVSRGVSLFKEVSNLRRRIMSDLAGVTYEEWSSYLDDESKPIPFPLSCTLPHVRDSKAFRTKAANDLKDFGEDRKVTLENDCNDPALNTTDILNLLEKSKPIFDEIKRTSELRIDKAQDFAQLSSEEKQAELNKDLSEYSQIFGDNGHPFPLGKYQSEANVFLSKTSSAVDVINFIVARGVSLYKEVSNIRRGIMASMAGVSREEWSSYLDNEDLNVPFHLSCTIPAVRESKAFRTKAANDLSSYGASAINENDK